MAQNELTSLWRLLKRSRRGVEGSIRSVLHRVVLNEFATGSALGGQLEKLRGRSVLIATSDQMTAAVALIELDGIARRLVICPPDLSRQYLNHVVTTAEVDAIVSDLDPKEFSATAVRRFVACSARITPGECDRRESGNSEWILFTSGTTGVPKLVLHTLSSLTGPISRTSVPVVWSTFYDIRRYGGLQILLRALVNGGSLVLSSERETIGAFPLRAAAEGVTHISGTPSHWRRALMSPSVRALAPRYVRLSGEIVDQTILDNLRAVFPDASIVHAFASTEAGVAFEVHDGLTGFPPSELGQREGGVAIKIEGGSLRIRSPRAASRYLREADNPLADQDGFIDTRDMVERNGDRFQFVGRLDGVINVAGLKVYPEEIETIINRHPSVLMSLAHSRKNPITGSLVAADVVAGADAEQSGAKGLEALKNDILDRCRQSLAPYKVPATIRFVRSLELSGAGKLARP